jgi:hypothetical protein
LGPAPVFGVDSLSFGQPDINRCKAGKGLTKPEMRGPRAGAAKEKDTQHATEYGRYSREYMSPMLAPPLARHGLPKKPSKKRKTRRPPRLSTREVGTANMTKMPNVEMYGMLRPNTGTV